MRCAVRTKRGDTKPRRKIVKFRKTAEPIATSRSGCQTVCSRTTDTAIILKQGLSLLAWFGLALAASTFSEGRSGLTALLA
jgi:hypothetical protein